MAAAFTKSSRSCSCSSRCKQQSTMPHKQQRHRAAALFTRATQRPIDLYAVLGVPFDADAAAIKAAFRARAKLLHPAVNPADDAEQAFRLACRAYEVLGDAMLRAAHDQELLLLLDQQAGSSPASSASSSGAAAALRARDPRFARFERWRREVLPDVEEQLDVWTAEVTGLLAAADAALATQERAFQALMMAAAIATPSCNPCGTYDDQQPVAQQLLSERQQRGRALLASMRGLLADATGNVQRLYDKRYEQLQSRFPGYPAIVWHDRWLHASDEWLDASASLSRKWEGRVVAVAQWMPASSEGGGGGAGGGGHSGGSGAGGAAAAGGGAAAGAAGGAAAGGSGGAGGG